MHPTSGELLDRALVLFFPAPRSATGEDVIEFHLHGGRAVVRSVLDALSSLPGLRAAEPGEFTRRAFASGRLDLLEAEGLADLLEAETDAQRRNALRLAGGHLSHRINEWRDQILATAAEVEAEINFSDEDDVAVASKTNMLEKLTRLVHELEETLLAPRVEPLRDGLRIVIAGPPNSGKSTLLNRLCGREAAIASDIPGTTRDLIEVPLSVAGMPLLLVDTAGIRTTGDQIERIGVARAEQAVDQADLVLWLGGPEAAPNSKKVICVHAKADLGGGSGDISVSALTGEGIPALLRLIQDRTRLILPAPDAFALSDRHRASLAECADHLRAAAHAYDLIITAEELRRAREELDYLTGRAGVEDMFDALFSRFCLGK
jgi:tRNA modification GTPase